MKVSMKRNWSVLLLVAIPLLCYAMPGVMPIVEDSNGVRRLAKAGDTLEGEAGSLISFGHLPPYGATLAYIGSDQVSLGTASQDSQVSDSTGAFAFKWHGVLTATISTSGAGGLDTGSETADTWYAVHAIADTSGTNAPDVLFSLSATVPTMPSGYDVFRRLGWARSDSGSDFLEFLQVWNGTTRRLVYDEDSPTMRVLNNGAATTYTDINLSAFVPPTAVNVMIDRRFEVNTGAAGDALRMRPDGFGGGSLWQFGPGVVSTAKAKGNVEIPCPGQIIEYRVDNANNLATLSVSGYDDQL